jgi:carbamoylphosphate synthase small subunit
LQEEIDIKPSMVLAG